MTSFKTHLKLIAKSPFFHQYLLCVVWCISLIFGASCADRMSEAFSYFFKHSKGVGEVSFLSLLLSVILPFLLSAFFVYRSKSNLLYIVCGLKAFSFGFCHFGTLLAFYSAGWLVRLLLFFSDSLAAVVLFCFWIRNINAKCSNFLSETCLYLLILIVILCVDILYISPFLNTLTFC